MSLRWRPTRAGIVNLYEYDNQIFEFAGGRLLLRGHNTSGKTKALELLLPFCLDGDINPHKLDPFAKSAKDMKWNLVGCVNDEQRVGYAWLEFERLGELGSEYVTCGVGMKAHRARDGVRRWYFVLPGRRVGHDLELIRGRHPLSRAELAETLDDGEALLDKPSDYRRALNASLFGFPTIEQYATMITLLLELRRPHLSKGLDQTNVRKLLSSSLPEVDEELMRRLGEGLGQLDELQAGVVRIEQARDRVRDFHRRVFRAYARAAVRDRGDALRSADGAFERASTAQRGAATALASARETADCAASGLQAAIEEREAAEGARDAIISSAEWATVAEVAQLGRTAEQAETTATLLRKNHNDAAARAAVDAQELADAAAISDATDSACDERLTELAALATQCGLALRHATLAAQLDAEGTDPVRWSATLRDTADTQLARLASNRELHAALAAATGQLERRRDDRERAQDEHRRAAERVSALDEGLQSASEALSEAIDRWTFTLTELELDASERIELVERALAAGGPAAADPAAVWSQALATRRDELASERAGLVTRADGLAANRSELEAERDALARAADDRPAAAPTRPADRSGRPGAPFWALVNFNAGISDADAAGLEAALEGAGLLDAWVLPEGVALDRETLDVVLHPGDGAGPRTLAELLHSEAGAPVADEVVDALLRSVAIADERAVCAVDVDGRFHLGPARGRFAKPSAEWIGAPARDRRRAARIAAIDAKLLELSSETRALEGDLRVLDERGEQLAAEVTAFPDIGTVGRARQALAVAADHAHRLADAVAEAEGAEIEASHERETTRCAVADHSAAHGFPDGDEWQGQWTAALHGYRAEARPCADALQAATVQARRAGDLEARHRAAVAETSRLDAEARDAASDSRRLASEHGAREAALGQAGAQLRAHAAASEARLKAARAGESLAHDADKEATAEAIRAEAKAGAAELETESARADRESLLGAFRVLEQADLFRAALEEDAPSDHAEASGWTLTRALEMLRAVPADRLAVNAPLDRLANQVTGAISELDRSLALFGDMGVSTRTVGGLIDVNVVDHARARSVPVLLEELEEELRQRERTLSAEQRRIFGETLLDEIAEHLRELISRVRDRVDDMNVTLAACPTGSGRTVQLEWHARADTDAGERMHDVLRLLRRSVATLTDAERAPLIDFFRDCVERARDAADTVGPAEQLRQAFDYRAWFDFDLIEVKDGHRTRLTAKRHAVGSGGEQAVLVHMPLFAAACALYDSARSSHAPRLIMLDEALSGIDDDTRAKVMDVLVRLDLDFVMTSHELWGTYHTVPSLSIYQLHRDNDLPGVAAERFLWDGELLHEREQGALWR
ncbi:MAG: TIGR02680 family protein [Solirubrobacteraceae bacterium]